MKNKKKVDKRLMFIKQTVFFSIIFYFLSWIIGEYIPFIFCLIGGVVYGALITWYIKRRELKRKGKETG
ncbi:Uncharacterised protein [uncultured archaeon]|nr:Uncharacterised protein [uncultured archaeon]